MSVIRSPRIALVVPALVEGGGVPAVARFIKDTIVREGYHEPTVVSLSTASTDPASVRMLAPSTWRHGLGVVRQQWENLPVLHVGAAGGEFEFQRYRPRRILSEALSGCDLVQVVAGSPAWANTVCGLGKPVSLHVATRARVERRERDALGHGMAGWWRKTMTRITDHLDDRGLHCVDAIQVMNPWMLDYARALQPHHAVDLRFAPPGVDSRLFHPSAPRTADQQPYLLCVGRLDDPRKRVGLLLEAYARLPDSTRTHVRLVLAGSSAPPAAFWERAEVLGVRPQITFIAHPDIQALVRLYQDASVFVLPSDEEGFGMVIVEAMACGIPVIATQCGGPDGIISDGRDGFLVPRGDAAALADRLDILLSSPDLRASMGRLGRKTVEHRFAGEVAGQAFLEVWERLLRSPGGVRCVA